MAGTRKGGLKSAAKNKANDNDFYVKIGRIGGRKDTGHTFAHGMVDPHIAGKVGGLKSKRGRAKAKKQVQEQWIPVPEVEEPFMIMDPEIDSDAILPRKDSWLSRKLRRL